MMHFPCNERHEPCVVNHSACDGDVSRWLCPLAFAAAAAAAVVVYNVSSAVRCWTCGVTLITCCVVEVLHRFHLSIFDHCVYTASSLLNAQQHYTCCPTSVTRRNTTRCSSLTHRLAAFLPRCAPHVSCTVVDR